MRIFNKDILREINPHRPTVIIHGCNCMRTMGAGIARYLSNEFPIILTIDKQTAHGDRSKLGTYSKAIISEEFHILNCYTQHHHRKFGGKAPVDYDAIRQCLRSINQEYDGWEIRSPKIGCGLAGGNWAIVKNIFEEELGSQDVKVYFI